MIACLVGPSFHDGSGSAPASEPSVESASSADANARRLIQSAIMRCLRRRKRAPAWSARSLPCSVARMPLGYRLLDLLFHGLKVEGRRLLHRRELDGRLRQFSDLLLHIDEAPEFTREELVHIAGRPLQQVGDRHSLERVLSNV